MISETIHVHVMFMFEPKELAPLKLQSEHHTLYNKTTNGTPLTRPWMYSE